MKYLGNASMYGTKIFIVPNNIIWCSPVCRSIRRTLPLHLTIYPWLLLGVQQQMEEKNNEAKYE